MSAPLSGVKKKKGGPTPADVLERELGKLFAGGVPYEDAPLAAQPGAQSPGLWTHAQGGEASPSFLAKIFSFSLLAGKRESGERR